jgi:hypothetical protein
LFVTCISVRRTSYWPLWRDLTLLCMGRKLQIASGFTSVDSDWGHIAAHVRSLWHIFNQLGDRMPRPSVASRGFFWRGS